MLIGGYKIDGDSDGLTYLRINEQAIRGLIDIVNKEGTAAFLYQDKRFVVMPTPSGTFIVAHSGGRSGKSGQRKTDNLTTKKYL